MVGGGDDASNTTTLHPGWNEIEFVIGDVGDDNVDSWAFLKANSFTCVAGGGGGGGGSTMMNGGTGGAADSPDVIKNHHDLEISLLMALVIAVVLGLIALSLPVVGLTNCNVELRDKEESEGHEKSEGDDGSHNVVTRVFIFLPKFATVWY